jgi:Uma2 family endonuclease
VTAATSVGKMTYAEYLAYEERSQTKHEFLNGEVFAMAGGTVEHGALAMAVGRALGNALEGKPCRVLGSDAKVRALRPRALHRGQGQGLIGGDEGPSAPTAIARSRL